MKSLSKILSAAAFLTLGGLAMAPAANAGTWHLDARSCPDIREDWRDARHTQGRYDRREDRRDSRVINCPARSWTYVADRYERRGEARLNGARRGTPGVVYQDRRGGFYRVARGGRRVPVDIVIRNHRGRAAYHAPRGRGRHNDRGPRRGRW
tara:strand:+ start:517 stop:972 length:456 start_codon:yes stop_codon:yes gene_type:complete